MSSEHERIAILKERFFVEADFLKIGIGDDAALIEGPKQLLISVDAAIEDAHFRADFAPWDILSYRAVIASLSDIYAMGAKPTALLSSLSFPSDFEDAAFDAVIEGIRQACADHNVAVIGGNLAASNQVAMHSTVMGTPYDLPVSRHGANARDNIWVTGFPGSAALGLEEILKNQKGEFAKYWLTPTLQPLLAKAISERASACVDISDGLLQDLGHICKASSVGATVNLQDIPRITGFTERCDTLACFAEQLLLTGGEGYELLFTAPEAETFDGASCIGKVIAEAGTPTVLDSGGGSLAFDSQGFDHFH